MKYKLDYNNDERISIEDMKDLIENIKKEKSKIDENVYKHAQQQSDIWISILANSPISRNNIF